MKKIPYLPDELIFDNVLPRLTAALLHGWRLVSKKWNHLFRNDAVFLDKQMVLSNPVNPGFFFSSVWPGTSVPRFLGIEVGFENICSETLRYSLLEKNIIWLSKSNVYMRIMGSCNGLLLMKKDFRSRTMFVVNPAIRESITLPPMDNHPERIHVGGIGYDPCTKKYKVVVLFCNYVALSCTIHTLGSTTWREISTPVLYTSKRLVNPAVVTDGFLHFGCYRGCPWHVEEVLSVDIYNETVAIEELPFRTASIWRYKDYVVAAKPNDIGFSLYTMKYCAGAEVVHNSEELQLDIDRKTLYPLGSFKDGEILIFKDCPRMGLWYYHRKFQVFEEIETPWGNNQKAKYSHMRFLYYDYVSTLVSPIAVAGVGGNNGGCAGGRESKSAR